MSILIYAASNRVIDDKFKKRRRLNFTIPQFLYCKRETEKEIERSVNDQLGLTEYYKQRASGKNILISLDNSLSTEAKFKAVKRLADKPLLIQYIYSEQPFTIKLAFKIMVTSEWLIAQRQHGPARQLLAAKKFRLIVCKRN